MRPAERDRDSFTLLSDTRVRLNGARYERYERRVRRAMTASGVERLAELLVDFEPEHEQLVLHRIELHRKGRVVDQTRSARVRLVAEESELERRMYNGGVTAFIVLSDVRVGDSIDLSYSVIGSAPILGGRYAGYFDLAGSDPVRQRHVEITGEAGRPELHGKVLGAKPTALTNQPIGPSWVDLQDIEPRPDEDRVPAAHQTPWLEVSEFGSWQEVAAWGAKLYPVLAPTREITEQAAALAGLSTDPEEVALRILRFVQDEVRYLAINNEGHALSPHPPRVVLTQRFGDCKDKTYLLLHLLKAQGIDAVPMLVHSGDGAYVMEHEPTPYAFDHVILRASIAGRPHYLDATYSQQGGTLETQVPPEFGYGLVLSPDTTALEALPTPTAPVPELHANTAVSVASDGSALLDVTTVFARRRADQMRDNLASESVKELAERYANFYQTEFPDVEVTTPLTLEDERLENRISIQEHYRVPKFWRDGERALYTESTDGYLKLPRVVRRTRPLGLSHPVWIKDDYRVMLPFRSGVEARHDVSEDDAFKFTRDIRNDGVHVNATFEYRSLANEVPLAKMSAHFEALQRARDWNVLGLGDEIVEQGAAVELEVAKAAPTSLKTFWIVGGVALVLLVWPAGRGLRGLRRRREFARRQRGGEGETAADATSATTRAVAETALIRQACSCGQSLATAPIAWTALRYQGAALHVARQECPHCGDSLRHYFNLTAEGSESAGDA